MIEFEATKENLLRLINGLMLTYHCVEILQKDFDTLCNDEVVNNIDVEVLQKSVDDLVSQSEQSILDCSNLSKEIFSKIKLCLPQNTSMKNQQIHAAIDQYQTSANSLNQTSATGAAVEYEHLDIVSDEDDLWAERVSQKDLGLLITDLKIEQQVSKDLDIESTIFGIESEQNRTVSNSKAILNTNKQSGEKFSIACEAGAFHLIQYKDCLLAFFDNSNILIFPKFVQMKGKSSAKLTELISPSYMNSYDAFGRNAMMTEEGLLIFLQQIREGRKNKSCKLSTIIFADLLASVDVNTMSDTLELPPYEVQLYPEAGDVLDFCFAGRDSIYILTVINREHKIIIAEPRKNRLKLYGSKMQYKPKNGDQIKGFGADNRSLLLTTVLEGSNHLELLSLDLKLLDRVQIKRYSRPVLRIEPVTFEKTHLFVCFHFAGEISVYAVADKKLHICQDTRFDHHNHTPSVSIYQGRITIWGNNTQNISLQL